MFNQFNRNSLFSFIAYSLLACVSISCSNTTQISGKSKGSTTTSVNQEFKDLQDVSTGNFTITNVFPEPSTPSILRVVGLEDSSEIATYCAQTLNPSASATPTGPVTSAEQGQVARGPCYCSFKYLVGISEVIEPTSIASVENDSLTCQAPSLPSDVHEYLAQVEVGASKEYSNTIRVILNSNGQVTAYAPSSTSDISLYRQAKRMQCSFIGGVALTGSPEIRDPLNSYAPERSIALNFYYSSEWSLMEALATSVKSMWDCSFSETADPGFSARNVNSLIFSQSAHPTEGQIIFPPVPPAGSSIRNPLAAPAGARGGQALFSKSKVWPFTVPFNTTMVPASDGRGTTSEGASSAYLRTSMYGARPVLNPADGTMGCPNIPIPDGTHWVFVHHFTSGDSNLTPQALQMPAKVQSVAAFCNPGKVLPNGAGVANQEQLFTSCHNLQEKWSPPVPGNSVNLNFNSSQYNACRTRDYLGFHNHTCNAGPQSYETLFRVLVAPNSPAGASEPPNRCYSIRAHTDYLTLPTTFADEYHDYRWDQSSQMANPPQVEPSDSFLGMIGSDAGPNANPYPRSDISGLGIQTPLSQTPFSDHLIVTTEVGVMNPGPEYIPLRYQTKYQCPAGDDNNSACDSSGVITYQVNNNSFQTSDASQYGPVFPMCALMPTPGGNQ
jgi:hypothetical protein